MSDTISASEPSEQVNQYLVTFLGAPLAGDAAPTKRFSARDAAEVHRMVAEVAMGTMRGYASAGWPDMSKCYEVRVERLTKETGLDVDAVRRRVHSYREIETRALTMRALAEKDEPLP